VILRAWPSRTHYSAELSELSTQLFSEADRLSPFHQTVRLLIDPERDSHIYNRQPNELILNQLNVVYIRTSIFLTSTACL
jgi:hypothetical protein